MQHETPDLDISASSHGYAPIQRHCARMLAKLDVICAEINEIEKELHFFLEEYYTRVGRYFLSPETDDFHSLDSLAPHEDNKALDFNSYSRSLYIELMRRHHPDQRHTADASPDLKMTQRIIGAYHSDNLSILWKEYFSDIFSDRNLSEASKNKMVFDFYHNLQLCVLKQRKKLQDLEQSEENRLRLRVFNARLEGVDLIQSIIRSITWDVQTHASQKSREQVRFHEPRLLSA